MRQDAVAVAESAVLSRALAVAHASYGPPSWQLTEALAALRAACARWEAEIGGGSIVVEAMEAIATEGPIEQASLMMKLCRMAHGREA